MKKSILLNLMLLIISWGIHAQTATPPALGDGTSGNPYQIATLENLYWIAAPDAEVASPTQTVRFAAHYIQTANIVASATAGWSSGWVPIGVDYEDAVFTGSYDGANHTISGLHITSSSSYGYGLFGITAEATIQNLGIVDVDINVSTSRPIGGLVGESYNVTIQNCYTSGVVSGGSSNGGLAGSAYNSTITNCYSTCNLMGATNTAGGLVGTCINSSITECYYMNGTVSVQNSSDTYTGGLIGYADLTPISKCYSDGIVAGSDYNGGLIGAIYTGTISNCYSRSPVTNTNAYNGSSGGLIGSITNVVTITNCYSTGLVEDGMGGFSGYIFADATLINSFWDTETSGTTSIRSSGIDFAGGTGTTNAAMKTQSTFTDAGWDFTTIWGIDEGSNDGYPYLTSVSVCSDGTLVLTEGVNIQTVCAYTEIIPVVYTVGGGATGAEVTGLPDGVSGSISSGTFTISGTPTVAGIYEYSVTTTGTVSPCTEATSTGTITVKISPTSLEPEGDGSSGNPYQIATLENLYWIAENSSAWNKYFTQTADIDASSTADWCTGGWTPIGYDFSHVFSGSYDGQGHIISGLHIANPSTVAFGLFGISDDAEIRNLGLTDVNISTTDKSGPTGALLGRTLYGSVLIYKCYSTGIVNGNDDTGGLVGLIHLNCTVAESYSTCDVNGKQYVGGLVGEVVNYNMIINCLHTTGMVKGNSYIGGLVGNNSGGSLISKCYSTGEVTGNSYTGGLAGKNEFSSAISNCYSRCNVSNISGIFHCGGLVGLNTLSAYITNCFSTGSVIATMGGLVGGQEEGAATTNSYWDKETSGTTSSAGGTAKTSDEMKTQSTFTDWDFTTIWGIITGKNDGYPHLLPATECTKGTLTLISGQNIQTLCATNTALTDIVYLVGGGASGANVSTLPSGVSGNYDPLYKTFTISGSPTHEVTYGYIVFTTGTYCAGSTATATGTISVNTNPEVRITGNNGSICEGGNAEFYLEGTPGAEVVCSIAFVGGTNTRTVRLNGGGTATVTAEDVTDDVTMSLISICDNALDGTSTVDVVIPAVSISGAHVACTSATLTAVTDASSPSYLWVTIKGEELITVGEGSALEVTESGDYGLVVTDGNGCMNFSEVFTVTFVAPPDASITGSSTISVGETTTLSPATGGTWTSSNEDVATVTGAGLVLGISAGTSTFTFTDEITGCSATTEEVTVCETDCVNGTIELTSGIAEQTVCAGTAITPIIYTIGGGASGSSISPAPPTGISGAYDSVSKTFTISGTPTVAGTYTYTVTTTGTASPCIEATATGTITVKLASAATQPEGDGTDANPYQIATLENLYWIAVNTSSWDKYFIQTADIDASATAGWCTGGWVPIGHWPIMFSGNYDGKGHTISGLTITGSSENHYGLFGRAEGAVFKNLGVTDVYINAESATGSSGVGALLGYADNVTIDNCYSTGVVKGNTYGSGGLLGTIIQTTVQNSYSTCDVSGVQQVGGLAGVCVFGSIVNCSHTEGIVNSNHRTGGLVGYINSSIVSKCHSTGEVKGNSSTGGLVGENNYSEINNSYSKCTVTGTSTGETCGGLVGYLFGSWGPKAYITNCYSTGSVTSGMGGLVGSQGEDAATIYSFWDTETSGTSTSAAGEGKSTIQMKSKSTFTAAGWDFTTIWGINAGCNDGYPYLNPVPEITRIPSVTITSDLSGEVCSDQEPIFTAKPYNTGGGDVSYIWKLNGVLVGKNQNPYILIDLKPGYVYDVSCEITVTNPACNSATATSDEITISVAPWPDAGEITGDNVIQVGESTTLSSTEQGGMWACDLDDMDIVMVDFTTGTVTGTAVGIATIYYGIEKESQCYDFGMSEFQITVTASSEPCTPPSGIIVESNSPVCEGDNLTLSSTASAGSIPFSYSWTGPNNFTSDSQNPVINSVTTADAGTFTVTISNSCGSVTNTIHVTLNPSYTPSVTISTEYPGNRICSDTSPHVTATPGDTGGGTVSSYQWYINGLEAGTGTNTIGLNELSTGDAISCCITITGGTCLTSQTAVSNEIIFEVYDRSWEPSVTIESDAGNEICPETRPHITAIPINANGGTVSYQWYLNGKTAGSGTNILGLEEPENVNTISCSITITDAACYGTGTAASDEITITVNPTGGTATTTTPSICPGKTAVLTLSGYLGSIQWQYFNGQEPVDVNGGTGSTSDVYTTPPLTQDTYFLAKVTGGTCSPTYSEPVLITVLTPPMAPTAEAQTFCSGDNPIVANLKPAFMGEIVYTWYDMETGGTPLETTAKLSTGTYYVSQTGNGCESARTAVDVTVNTTPGAPTAEAQMFCTGDDPRVSGLQASGDAGATFSWYYSELDATPIFGKVGLTTGTYYVSQTVNGCESARTAVIVTVDDMPDAGELEGSQLLCVGKYTTLFAEGGDAGGTWSSSNTEVASVIQPGIVTGQKPGTATISYTVGGSGGCAGKSDVATLVVTIVKQPDAGNITGAETLCIGATAQLSSDGDAEGFWMSSDEDIVEIDGNGAVKALSAGTALITYLVTGSGGCAPDKAYLSLTVFSNSVAPVSVASNPETSESGNHICPGELVTLTLSGGNLGTDPDAVWTWYEGSCSSGEGIGTGESIEVQPSETTSYFVCAEGGCISSTGDCASVTVSVFNNFDPGSILTSGETFCYNGDPGLISSQEAASGGSGTYVYQWQSSVTGPSTGFAAVAGNFFDSFTEGSNVAVDDPEHFTTWSSSPGSLEDGVISTSQYHSAPNSTVIKEPTDLLLKLGNKTTGKYDLSWWMYIPTGKCGYYNIMHNFNPADPYSSETEWAFEIYFRTNGELELWAGENINSTYPKDQWFKIEHSIDLDNDLMTLYVDGNQLHSWPFHYQSTSTSGTNKLGYVDFFADWSGGIPEFYIDDIYYADKTLPETVVLINGLSNSGSYDPPSGLRQTTWYRRQAKDEGCNTEWINSAGTWMVTVNSLPAPSITGPEAACLNSAGNEYYTEAGMTGYVWNISSGGSITAGDGTNSITVTWNSAGPHTVSVNYTNSSGCIAANPAVRNVTVNTLPAPSITGPEGACLNSAGNEYYTETGMTGYFWNVSSGGLITAGDGTNSITVTWNSAGPQTVSVNYTNSSGCTAANPAVRNVTVNTLPAPSITGQEAACLNSEGNEYYTEAGMTGYVWNVSSGGSITAGDGTNSITVTWNSAGPQTVSVNYSNSSGCTAAAPEVRNVTVNPIPVAIITGNNNPVCSGGNVEFYLEGTPGVLVTYSLDGGLTTATITLADGTATVTAENALSDKTLTLVKVEDTTTGCSCGLTTSSVAVVNLLPTADISGETTVCQNDPSPKVSFTGANGIPAYTFFYNINNGETLSISTGGTNTATISVPTASPGIYVYTLESVTDGNGCSQAQAGSVTVTINALPLISIVPPSPVVDYSDPVTITITVSDDGAGSSLSLTTTVLPENLVLNQTGTGTYSGTWTISGIADVLPGTYPITVTADDGMCESSTTFNLVVGCDDALASVDNSESYFTADPTSGIGDVWLRASISDFPDGYPGDVRNATVQFLDMLTTPSGDIGGTVSVVTTEGNTVSGTAIYTKVGHKLTNTEMTMTGGHAWLVTVEPGDNSYYCWNEPEPKVVVLAMPGGDFVTGGGHYVHEGRSAGKNFASAGSRMNFGFNMKWNKSGKNLQGQINIIYRAANGKIYHIKSNAITSLAVNQITVGGKVYNSGTMITKANLSEIIDGVEISITGNLSLKVVIWDWVDEYGGKEDKITVELLNGAELLYSSHLDGISIVGNIGGGNINVRNADEIYIPPSCGAPTGLKATNVTTESALITWDPVSGETVTYTLVLSTYSPTESICTFTGINTNYKELTDLEEATTYVVNLQRICPETSSSLTSTMTFTTASTFSPTTCTVEGLNAITDNTNKVTLAWASGADSYKAEYRKTGTTKWTLISSTVPNVVLKNLSTNTEYEWQVTPVCGGNTGTLKCGDNFRTGSTRVKSLEVPVSKEEPELKVYPNPFSERLRFEFVSPADDKVRIQVFDATGRLVETVFDNLVESGVTYMKEFRPASLVTSMYFYRITIGEEVFTGKVIYKK